MRKAQLADEQLVHLFQKTNSADSFETLYKRYVDKVYQKCLSITQDSEAAQDYTQDIFLKVFTKLDSFQNRSTFSTWLYSISHNYCLDQLRITKRLNTEGLSDEVAGNLPEADALGFATDRRQTEERIQVVERVLLELPEDEVKLLRLKYEQGLSIRTISQQYHLTDSAVKMRLKRTRDRLQKLYTRRLFEL